MKDDTNKCEREIADDQRIGNALRNSGVKKRSQVDEDRGCKKTGCDLFCHHADGRVFDPKVHIPAGAVKQQIEPCKEAQYSEGDIPEINLPEKTACDREEEYTKETHQKEYNDRREDLVEIFEIESL